MTFSSVAPSELFGRMCRPVYDLIIALHRGDVLDFAWVLLLLIQFLDLILFIPIGEYALFLSSWQPHERYLVQA